MKTKHVHTFHTPAAQMIGLMFRRQPPLDHAFVFPLNRPKTVFVNTFFMRFAIDVTVLDAAGGVIALVQMRPWQVRVFRGASTIIETAAADIEI